MTIGPAVREQFERAIRDKVGLELDLSFVHPITGIRNVHSVSHRVLDQYGDLREIVGTVIDITERKRAEQTLRQSEAYLAEAQKLSHTGSWGWSLPTGDISWSDETFRIFECDRTIKPTLDLVLQRVHPDDRHIVQQVIEHASRNPEDFDDQASFSNAGRLRQMGPCRHPYLRT